MATAQENALNRTTLSRKGVEERGKEGGFGTSLGKNVDWKKLAALAQSSKKKDVKMTGSGTAKGIKEGLKAFAESKALKGYRNYEKANINRKND